MANLVGCAIPLVRYLAKLSSKTANIRGRDAPPPDDLNARAAMTRAKKPPRDRPQRIVYVICNQRQGNAQMADRKHGSMDTKEQEKTFAGFLRFVTWGAVITIGILIFLALANA
jgi:hypothetical protein